MASEFDERSIRFSQKSDDSDLASSFVEIIKTTIEQQDCEKRLNSKMALFMLTMKRLSMKSDSKVKARTHCVQRVTPQHKEIIPRNRAATLPPCNLFPMDPAKPKCPVVQSPKLQRQKSKSTTDFSVIPYQTAICHFFSYKKRKWRNMRIQVQLAPLPFARGSSRAAFYMKIAGDKYIHVAKQNIDPTTPADMYFRDSEMQAHCAHFARQFNSFKPPRHVRFLKTWVLELLTTNGGKRRSQTDVLGGGDGVSCPHMMLHHSRFYGVERHIRGKYRKHNNNFGFVDDDVARNTPQAFSHFTLEASAHNAIVVDIQGVNDVYTDPQMHTVSGNNFGDGNLGMRGILRFCQTHQCNNICRYLDLPPINPKQIDSGTVCVRSPLQNLTSSVTNNGVQSGHATQTALPTKTKTNSKNRKSKPLSTIDTNVNHADHKNKIRVGGKENTASCTQETSHKRQLVPKPFKENHYFSKDENLSRHLVLSGSRRSRARVLGVRPRDAPTCSTCAVM